MRLIPIWELVMLILWEQITLSQRALRYCVWRPAEAIRE